MWVILLVILLSFMASWYGWTYYVMASQDSPRYTVAETRPLFEIRQYEPFLAAQVEVLGRYQAALQMGFRILSDYFLGSNTQAAHISMVAPVIEAASTSESAAAPEEAHLITFILPHEYSPETLPAPHDGRIAITPVPARRVAAQRFSWYATPGRVARKKAGLVDAVRAAGFSPLGQPAFASYNDPYAFPPSQKHEIWVEIN